MNHVRNFAHDSIRCEHYDGRAARDHYVQYLDDAYDLDYLEAFFYEDDDELNRIEDAARALGYGPLAKCTTIANASSQKVHCRQSSIPIEVSDPILTATLFSP